MAPSLLSPHTSQPPCHSHWSLVSGPLPADGLCTCLSSMSQIKRPFLEDAFPDHTISFPIRTLLPNYSATHPSIVHSCSHFPPRTTILTGSVWALFCLCFCQPVCFLLYPQHLAKSLSHGSSTDSVNGGIYLKKCINPLVVLKHSSQTSFVWNSY